MILDKYAPRIERVRYRTRSVGEGYNPGTEPVVPGRK